MRSVLFNCSSYEYNGRQLKVHYDKYLQSSQPLTTPASPLLNHALQSGPSGNSNSFSRSMSARPANITLPAGYQFDFGPASPTSPYDMYHSQLQASMQQQHQQQQQQQQLRHYRNSSSNDVDNLSSRLTLSHISNNTTSSLTQKPSLSQTAPSTSGNHTTANVNTSRNLDQSASASAHQHPHHPGPISLPPPPQATSFPTMSPNLSPHGLGMGAPLSPHHYNMTPLQQPSQQQSQIITPHGLPPITPSMPPFTFLPPPQMPPTPTHNGPNSHFSFSQSQSFSPMHPLPSPGAPSSHPPSPMHPSHAHHQHVMSTFSPGVAMSPGAFWGRPGGSNPFINPTVGAPVHMHSPGHGGFFYQIPSPGHVGGGTSGSVCDPQERGRRRSSSTTTSWHTSDEDSRILALHARIQCQHQGEHLLTEPVLTRSKRSVQWLGTQLPLTSVKPSEE
ncbi:hypothetical protein BD779DRAFT_446930 [Infundibulicybe gibba]|nr:hypothetical protein BD779DRAFT_446930 [Infundibulicybe gibba]